MFLICGGLIDPFCNGMSYELQMKGLLESIEGTWKVMSAGPENEILRQYAEESKIFTIRYASELPLSHN